MKSIFAITSLMLLSLARLAIAAEGEDGDPRESAWDRSVALETKGDLAGAEQIMVQGWGEHPDNYWVRLRLAYLALLQQRYGEARSGYQSLRERSESEGDQDIVRGMASAIAGGGWVMTGQGSVTDARAAFREALALDPKNQSAALGLDKVSALPIAEPEVWVGAVGQSSGPSQYQGWALYGHVPVRLSDVLVLRVAGRYIFSQPSGGSGRGGGKASWSVNEQYLGLAYLGRRLGADLVAVRTDSSGAPAIWGGAGRLRLGSKWGFLTELSVLHAANVATNTQARPMLFAYLGTHLGLQAGARLTFDDRGNAASASLGASVLLAPLAIYLQGHAGQERWAVGLAGPSVLSFNATTSYGGGVTLTWDVSRKVRLALQTEVERLRQGVYWNASGGVQIPIGSR
jgi:tetratricopeptide (TPR) repeat protein